MTNILPIDNMPPHMLSDLVSWSVTLETFSTETDLSPVSPTWMVKQMWFVARQVRVSEVLAWPPARHNTASGAT